MGLTGYYEDDIKRAHGQLDSPNKPTLIRERSTITILEVNFVLSTLLASCFEYLVAVSPLSSLL
jgi:hypothetical protein